MLDDLNMMFATSLVFYKNKPVYVLSFANAPKGSATPYVANAIDIISGRYILIPVVDGKEFASVTRRLGFVNILDTTFHVSRIPVRKYKVGLNSGNTKLTYISTKTSYSLPSLEVYVKGCSCPELVDTLYNRYPSFSKALEMVKGFHYAVAFDRQFAITKDRKLFYKAEEVGTVPANASTVFDIAFYSGKEYLIQLMDGNYEKTIRNIIVG